MIIILFIIPFYCKVVQRSKLYQCTIFHKWRKTESIKSLLKHTFNFCKAVVWTLSKKSVGTFLSGTGFLRLSKISIAQHRTHFECLVLSRCIFCVKTANRIDIHFHFLEKILCACLLLGSARPERNTMYTRIDLSSAGKTFIIIIVIETIPPSSSSTALYHFS